MESVAEDCEELMMCGLPLFNHRWFKSRMRGQWLPSADAAELPGTPSLTLINKTLNAADSTIRYEFELKGPPHMSIFLLPLEDVTLTDWSFVKKLLQEPQNYPPPYHVYFSYGKDPTPLKFHFDFQVI